MRSRNPCSSRRPAVVRMEKVDHSTRSASGASASSGSRSHHCGWSGVAEADQRADDRRAHSSSRSRVASRFGAARRLQPRICSPARRSPSLARRPVATRAQQPAALQLQHHRRARRASGRPARRGARSSADRRLIDRVRQLRVGQMPVVGAELQRASPRSTSRRRSSADGLRKCSATPSPERTRLAVDRRRPAPGRRPRRRSPRRARGPRSSPSSMTTNQPSGFSAPAADAMAWRRAVASAAVRACRRRAEERLQAQGLGRLAARAARLVARYSKLSSSTLPGGGDRRPGPCRRRPPAGTARSPPAGNGSRARWPRPPRPARPGPRRSAPGADPGPARPMRRPHVVRPPSRTAATRSTSRW